MTSIRRLTDLALGSRPHCQEHPERSMIDFTGCAVCRSRYEAEIEPTINAGRLAGYKLDGVITITIKGGQVTDVDVSQT